MRSRLRLLIILGAALLNLGSLTAPVHAQNFGSPQAMLLGYYAGINLRNYPQAYGYWINPSQSYADFANGYLTTDRVEPYLGDFQANPGSAAESGRVPAVLLGYHTDGSLVSYHGCFVIGQNAAGWRILGASFDLIADGYFPDGNTLAQYLSINCYSPAPVAIQLGGSAPDKGEVLLTAYYHAINRRDYPSAYAMWLQPLPGPKPNGAPATDYRPTYQDFVAGYANTVYVFAHLGAYNETGASAGHGYMDGFLPAVLIGVHTDGSVAAYYGCYAIGSFLNNGAPGSLGIVNGKFFPFTASGTATPTTDAINGKAILQALSADCTAFAVPF